MKLALTHLQLCILTVSHQTLWELETWVTGPTGRYQLRFNNSNSNNNNNNNRSRQEVSRMHEILSPDITAVQCVVEGYSS